MSMGVAKSTIYDVVKRSEDGKTMKHQGRGKQAVKMTSSMKKESPESHLQQGRHKSARIDSKIRMQSKPDQKSAKRSWSYVPEKEEGTASERKARKSTKKKNENPQFITRCNVISKRS